MTIYLSDRTGASIDSVLDNADAGNIGKETLAIITTDIDLEISSGFYRVSDTAANNPSGLFGSLIVCSSTSTVTTQLFTVQTGSDDKMFFRRKLTTWSAWQEIYHTGNTDFVVFDSAVADGERKISLGQTSQTAASGSIFGASVTTAYNQLIFKNNNGVVGAITTSGTATSYTTSSDPRLKDFSAAPSDTDIDSKFNDLFGAFRTFNWKNDPAGDLVWGFDAHATIDAGLDVGSEGEGPRELALGDVYNTTPAVTENRVVMDSEGNPTDEIETVVITEAIEHKVSPAGVDQSKAVPILLAKIEQLERRLVAAGL